MTNETIWKYEFPDDVLHQRDLLEQKSQSDQAQELFHSYVTVIEPESIRDKPVDDKVSPRDKKYPGASRSKYFKLDSNLKNNQPQMETEKDRNAFNFMIVHAISVSHAEPISGKDSQKVSEELHVHSNSLTTPINTTYQHVCSKKNFHGNYFKIGEIDSFSPIESYMSRDRGEKIAGPGRVYLLAMKIAYTKYLNILEFAGFDSYGANFLVTPEIVIDKMIQRS